MNTLFLTKAQVGSITVEVYKVNEDDEEPYKQYRIVLEDENDIVLNDYEFNNLQTIIKMINESEV